MRRHVTTAFLLFVLLPGTAFAQTQTTGNNTQAADRQAQAEREQREAERARKERNKEGKKEPGTRCGRWKAGRA